MVVEPCKIVSFTADSAIADTNYRILTDSMSTFLIAHPTFTQTPACQYTQTFTTTVDTNALSNPLYRFLTQPDPNYDVYETDISYAGIYNVVLTSTLNDSYWVAAGTANSDTTFQL